MTIIGATTGIKKAAAGGTTYLNQVPGLPATYGYWPAQEGSGTTVTDHSAYGHNGSLVGSAIGWSAGKWGNCVNITTKKVSSYMSVNTPAIDPREITVALWANITTANDSYSTLLSLYDNSGNNSQTQNASPAWTIAQYNIAGSTPWSALFSSSGVWSAWAHFALVSDAAANYLSIYLNGSLLGQISGSWPSSKTLSSLLWGGDASHSLLVSMQEMRLYNVALSSSQVSTLAAYVPV